MTKPEARKLYRYHSQMSPHLLSVVDVAVVVASVDIYCWILTESWRTLHYGKTLHQGEWEHWNSYRCRERKKVRLLTLLTRILVVYTKAQQEPMRSIAQVHKGGNEERSPSTQRSQWGAQSKYTQIQSRLSRYRFYHDVKITLIIHFPPPSPPPNFA